MSKNKESAPELAVYIDKAGSKFGIYQWGTDEVLKKGLSKAKAAELASGPGMVLCTEDEYKAKASKAKAPKANKSVAKLATILAALNLEMPAEPEQVTLTALPTANHEGGQQEQLLFVKALNGRACYLAGRSAVYLVFKALCGKLVKVSADSGASPGQRFESEDLDNLLG